MKPLTGEDCLRVMEYLRDGRSPRMCQYGMSAQNFSVRCSVNRFYGDSEENRGVQSLYNDADRDWTLERALASPFDSAQAKISPKIYFPVGELGIINRVFFTLPWWVPTTEVNISNRFFWMNGDYQFTITTERDKRPLERDLSRILNVELEPLEQRTPFELMNLVE